MNHSLIMTSLKRSGGSNPIKSKKLYRRKYLNEMIRRGDHNSTIILEFTIINEKVKH